MPPLYHTHSRSVVHCDLKLNNIMMSECGDINIIDWDCSAPCHDGGEQPQAATRGTSFFMDLERLKQDDCKLTPAADM